LKVIQQVWGRFSEECYQLYFSHKGECDSVE
jgi:hypothetical protein